MGVVFSFADSVNGLNTSFGISLKKYFGQALSTDEMSQLGNYLNECKGCSDGSSNPEGMYTFIP